MPETHDRKGYDLHVHTNWSYDALSGVEDVFKVARDLGVGVIAITDHHVADSFGEASRVAVRYPGVRNIRAAELSVTTSLGGVDLLVYGMPASPAPELASVLGEYHEWQRRRATWIIGGLRALGFDYSAEEHDAILASYRPREALAVQGRTHIRNAIQRDWLLKHGIISSEKEFEPLLDRIDREWRAQPDLPAADRVTAAAKAAGAVIVIAHPVGYFRRDDVGRMDRLVEECRLDGIECAHHRIPEELTGFYRDYCVRRGLVSTAGTDCHEVEHMRERLGRHGGKAGWLEELLERLPR